DDMSQQPGAVSMQNFPADICVPLDHSLPRSLHQDLADQFFLGQMANQDRCSIDSKRYEVYVKQIEGDFAHPFHMMRKIRCGRDQNVLQYEQTQSNEIQRPQILELIHEHVEKFLRPSQDDRNADLNSVSHDEHRQRKDTEAKACDRHRVAGTVAYPHDQRAHHDHQRVIEKILFVINGSWLFHSIQLMENSRIVVFHDGLCWGTISTECDPGPETPRSLK